MQIVFIRKRGKKYVVTLEYRDIESGKKKQKALSSHDKKKEAEKSLIESKSKINNNDFIMPEKITFQEYITSWLEQHKNNLSPTTHNRYKSIINKDIIPCLGDIELQKLNAIHIQKFYNKMLDRLSGKTVMQYHRIIHKSLSIAYKMQVIPKNPAEFVEVPKVKKYKASVYDKMEVRQLLEAVKNTRLEAPINLALGLGLRAGEVLGLRWTDVDFDKGIINIAQTAVRGEKSGDVIFKDPKSETSSRTLTTPEDLLKILKEHKVIKNEHNLVFTQITGKPMSSASFSRMFRDFLKRKNLPLIRFHDLRHTNATLMLASGTSAKVASSRLGHSSIGITMDLYTHVLQELEQDAADKLNDVIYK
jgi:integrase